MLPNYTFKATFYCRHLDAHLLSLLVLAAVDDAVQVTWTEEEAEEEEDYRGSGRGRRLSWQFVFAAIGGRSKQLHLFFREAGSL